MLLRAVSAAALLAGVGGHSSMIMPPARNSIDATLAPWRGGKHPPTGVIERKSTPCTNGTSPCDSGQSTFWFSQGCTPGCRACTGNGSRLANFDHCPDEPKSHLDELLPRFRTANRNAAPGSPEDVFKFNPWRHPGQAPTYDACGMAGGGPVGMVGAAEYNSTAFAKQGDLGKVLKPRPSGTVWKRGTIAYVRQQSSAQHGGG